MLIDKIQKFYSRFVFMPSDEANLIFSLWTAHTWRYDAAYATPYIYLHSPEKQSGKTKCLEVCSHLVKNPMMAASLTDAVLFRAIQEFEPTLIIDEVDTIFHGAKNESMRAVLNSGYRHSGFVWRIVKGSPERFKTFGPKVLAGINNLSLPDTVRDRAIPIRMRRKPKSFSIEPFYVRDVRVSPEREEILEGLERWAERHYDDLKSARPEPIYEISDRQWEIAEPLVTIAQTFGIEDEARAALLNLFEEGEDQHGPTDAQILLMQIAAAFKEHGMKRISSRDLVEKLGDGITMKKLSNELAPYGLHPKPLRIGNSVTKGYELSEFAPIFESYL